MTTDSITVSRRFCGPSDSGNGGYVCGRLAEYLPGCAVVRLKRPPPLETALRVEVTDSEARLLHDSAVVAEARLAELDVQPPLAPSFVEAQRAAEHYAGFSRHAFPRCFVCGPLRDVGDGMRIFPGSSGVDSVVAAPWIPDASLADDSGQVGAAFLWAALDCPGAFAVMPRPEPGKAVVLGELCVRIDNVLAPHEECVVIGWKLHDEGRKHFAGSAVFSSAGRAVAVGRATWIEVASTAFEKP